MRVAMITGGGSGVGRAVALKLVEKGWAVSVLGRREEPLEETRGLAADGGRVLPVACDIADAADVRRAVEGTVERFGRIEGLVNSAGLNIPNRSLEKLSLEDYQLVIDVNLTGAFNCVHAVLPMMREAGRGTIVNIVSDAGVMANATAGAAYVASKFGLRGLTQSINAEERRRGIRGCAIFPGEINTPLLDKRPAPPPMEARERMLQAEDVAACAVLAMELPERALIEELLIRPTAAGQ